MRPMHLHRAHGLTFLSELDLAGFASPADPVTGGPADVDVRLGRVPDRREAMQSLPYGAASPGLFVMEAGPGGRFLVEEGRRITVDCSSATDPDLVLLYLTGPGMAALLIQRGDLVLHGNALQIDGRGVVLCGPPACGKSSTAAALRARGASLLADDVSAVRFDEGPQVHPGCGPLKVRRQGLAGAGMDAEGWSPLRPDAGRVAVAFEAGERPFPLEAVYLLGGKDGGAMRLRGRQICQKSSLFVYRPELVAALGRAGDGLMALGALARHARVVELPEGTPAEAAEAVWRDLRRDLGDDTGLTVRDSVRERP